MDQVLRTEPEGPTSASSSSSPLSMNPALQSLTIMTIVSLATWTGQQAGNTDPFVLQAPLQEELWQLPLSVYAHQSPEHLAGNAMVVLVVGGIISIGASWVRFHLFFLSVGVVAGVSQVVATDALGDPIGVLGASGAAFALVGYFATGNSLSSTVLRGASVRVIVSVVAGIALLLTIRSAGMGIANVTHFVGALLGLLAGQFNLLRPRSWGFPRSIVDRVRQ